MSHQTDLIIDLLIDDKINFTDVVRKLAKKYPDILLELVNPTSSVDRKIVEFVNNGEIVNAIKLAREEYGFGLKEAKDLIDNFRSEYLHGVDGLAVLNHEQRHILNNLAVAFGA